MVGHTHHSTISDFKTAGITLIYVKLSLGLFHLLIAFAEKILDLL